MSTVLVLFAFIGLFGFYKAVHGSDLYFEEHTKPEEIYSKLKHIKTGYGQESVIGIEISEELLTDDDFDDKLFNKIRIQHNNLACGYAFSCLFHLKMVREILGHDRNIHIVSAEYTTGQLSFSNETKTMLATLFNLKSTQHNVIGAFWFFYMYLEILQEYIELPNHATSLEDLSTILEAHNAVDERLRSLTNKSCDQENLFDYTYTDSYFNVDSDFDKEVRRSRHSKIEFIVMNKNAINRLMRFNNDYGVSTDGDAFFSYPSLYLNFVMTDNAALSSFDIFQIQYNRQNVVFDGIKTNYNLIRTEQRPDLRSKRLGRFQNDFVNALKAIMLRIVWKYMLYITESPVARISNFYFSKLVYMIPYYNLRMSIAIAKFLRFFDLNGDQHFEDILYLMDNLINIFFVKFNSKLVVEHIEKAMSDIYKQFSFDVVFEPVKFERDESSDPIIQYYKNVVTKKTKLSENDLCYWLDTCIKRANIFIEHVKWILRGINFKVVNSFMRYANDLETLSTTKTIIISE